MKRLIVLALVTLGAVACATSPAISSPSADPASAVSVEVKSIDPLARALTSATFTEHASKALALAGNSDPIFSQCVQFGLHLGQELKSAPLIDPAQFKLVNADPTCPLCVLEAKRQDVAAIESGVFSSQLGTTRARVIDIRRRLALACGPLYMDEQNILGHATSLFGGLL